MSDKVLLVTRSDCRNDQLGAWLRHHLPLCEKAIVLLARRPLESPAEVSDVVAQFSKVTVVDFPSDTFVNADTCRRLTGLAEKSGCDVVIHLDKDEFITRPDKISGIVDRIRSGQSDYAEGSMVCRFAPGGRTYSGHQETYQDLCSVAPVQSRILRAYRFSDVKCYLTRAPHIRFHGGAVGWKKDPEGMLLAHFRWTDDCAVKSEVKCTKHPVILQDMIRRRDNDVLQRTPEFLEKLEQHTLPAP